MKKLLKFTGLLISTVLLVSACNNSSKQPKQNSPQKKSQNQALKINIKNEPQSLDPRKARCASDMNVIRMFMEGLTRIDKSGTCTLALAEKVTVSEDSKTYTFTIKDAYWSNGDPITSHDFAYTWKKSLSSAFPSPCAGQLFLIKNAEAIKNGRLPNSLLGIDTPDEKTLVVELNYPAPYFLELTAHPIFFPINVKIDKQNPSWAESVETYIGSGPFTLHRWNHQYSIQAEKSQSYWDSKAVHLQTINMSMVQEATGLLMFEKKELDWEGSPFTAISPDALDDLKENNCLKSSPSLATYMVRINTEKPPFNLPEMRKAFALAINRQEIVDYVTQGGQIPATGLVPPTLSLHNEPYFFDANKEKALMLFETALEKSGVLYEKLPQITLSYVAGDRNHQIAQAMQHQWLEAFGIKVNLAPTESNVYFSKLSTKDYQLAYSSWIADFSDPINFLEAFKTKLSGTNNTNWENPEFIQNLDKSHFVRNQEKRLQTLTLSEAIMMQDMPVIPIFHNTMQYVQNPQLKKVVLSSTGVIDFKWAYFE
ncbi:MAG: peptide ABC transporter substrate-binding protein [Simkaniaceae bacterium]|nr:peptide ABC transporter substrate-binding protein [Simkaniaceae bacterium]